MNGISKVVGSMVAVAALALVAGRASAQVPNGGFETLSGAYTTGAQSWSDNSSPANNGSTASAHVSATDPFAGLEELTLTYQNSANPGIGPSVIGGSDLFGGVSPGTVTLQF